jgi:hypothetical protein
MSRANTKRKINSPIIGKSKSSKNLVHLFFLAQSLFALLIIIYAVHISDVVGSLNPRMDINILY